MALGFKKHISIYSFELGVTEQKEKQKHRETKRFSICQFTPQMATMTRDYESGKILEPGPYSGCPMWMKRLKHLGHLLLLFYDNYKGARSEVEHLSPKQAPILDVEVTSSSCRCYTTMSVSVLVLE